MFDINKTMDKYFTIKLEDNTELHFDNLNYKLYAELYTLGNYMAADHKDTKKVKRLYKSLTKLFNNNLEKRKFKQKEIENMLSDDVAMHLIKAYQEHMNETLLLINKAV